MPQVVAIVIAITLVVFAAYQVVLLIGVPVARFAWGGEDHYLQPRFRTLAKLAIFGCAVGIAVAVEGSGIFVTLPAVVPRIACFTYVALLFAAFILTARSRSRLERRVMLPLYLALSAMFLIVALAGNPAS